MDPQSRIQDFEARMNQDESKSQNKSSETSARSITNNEESSSSMIIQQQKSIRLESEDEKELDPFFVSPKILVESGFSKSINSTNKAYYITHALDTDSQQWLAIENAVRVGIYDIRKREHIDSINGTALSLTQAIRRSKLKLSVKEESSSLVTTPRAVDDSVKSTSTFVQSASTNDFASTLKSASYDEPKSATFVSELTYDNFKQPLVARTVIENDVVVKKAASPGNFILFYTFYL
jgi:hypothetical protein